MLAAYVLFDFVYFAAWLAVILFCYDEGGPALAGLAAVVQLLPAAVLAPMLASVGDRMPRGRALVLVLACVARQPAASPWSRSSRTRRWRWSSCASTAVTTTLATVRPVHFAALPQLAASPEELVSANALSSVADGLMRFVGPVVTGIAVALYRPLARPARSR